MQNRSHISHMLVLDGAYLVGTEPPVFRRIAPPGEAELQALVERLASWQTI